VDHVGGTWFKGLFDEMNEKPAVVQYSKMTGRSALEDEDIDEILQGEGGFDACKEEAVIDLKVTDWKPHLARVPAFEMQDPKKYPRFPEAKVAVVDNVAATAVVYASDFDSSRTKAFVNMSRMRGRDDDDKEVFESDLVEVEVGGRIDTSARVAAAEEKMSAVSRGQDFTSKHGTISANAVDMSKQRGREAWMDKKDDGESTNAMTTAMPETFSHQRRVIGVADWNKMSGRGDNEDEEKFLDMPEQDMLMLEPNTNQSSKYDVNVRIVIFPLLYVIQK